MSSAERGVALLEALVAAAVFAGAGVGVIALFAADADATRRAAAAEGETVAADRVLAAITLLTSSELDARLGTRRAGEFVVKIQRRDVALFHVAIATADSVQLLLLETLVYRP